ncbi:MAG: PAS domain-containing protein, partial [Verrucomicrobiales bacterium]|nr:PAS domain-containing protein [Verrucomicrobiales bacterium]
MEAAGDGFVVVDPAGRVARLNGAAERLTGYSGAEASGRLLSEIVPLLDPTTGRPVIGAMWDAVLSSAEGLPCSLVALLSDRNGSERSVAATAVPIRSVTTHVVSGAVLILRDRTEYLNQERHRREQDEDFAAVLEASPEAIGVINTVSGKFEKLNHQAEVVLKRSREELLRLGPAEVSPATQPDGRASREVAKEHIAEALRGGRPVFEWAHLDGRGNTVLCEVRLVALPPPRHHLVRFSVTDITDRKRQEAEARRLQENLEQRVAERTAELAESAARLRESLRLLESVVEHAPTRVFWKDAQSRYLGCNSLFAADAGCRSPAEVIGKTDFELTWKDQAELYRADDRAVIDTGAFKLGYEEPQTTPDGRRLWLRTSKVPLHDEKGVIVGVLGIYEDITEHKELEAQFRQAQKLEAIGQLAGGVAHDFNNILAANLMTLGLMRMNPDLDPETRQSLDDLETHTRHAANLTNQLLMFSRRSVLTLRPIDANQVVARLLKMLERLIGEHIELRFDDRGAALMVEADSGMLEQVLINLAVNARDAMPKGGTIVVRTEAIHFPDAAPRPLPPRRPGAFVCLSMSDTGCGMD